MKKHLIIYIICLMLAPLSLWAQVDSIIIEEAILDYDVADYDDSDDIPSKNEVPSFPEILIREYNHAVNLNTQKDYIKAFEAFHAVQVKAEKIIDEEELTPAIMHDQDFYFYMRLLNSIGQCAFALGQYSQEEKYLNVQDQWLSNRLEYYPTESYELIMQLANYYKSYADLVMMLGDNTKALGYYNTALQYVAEYEVGNAEMQIRANIAQLYYKEKRYDIAEEHLDTIINYYNRPTDNIKDREEYYIAVADKAMCQARMGEFFKANKAIDDILENLPQGTKFYQEICRRKAKVIMLGQPYLQTKESDIKKATKIYRNHFDWIRNDVKSKFAWLTESQREEYWMNTSNFVTDSYCLENNAADLLYDVTLYRKAILLQLGSGFEDLLTTTERDSLDNMRIEDIFSDDDEEVLPSTKYELRLMSRIMHDGRLEKFFFPLNYTWKDVQKKMPKNGCAIEFVQYEREERPFMGAIVISKGASKPQFIPLFEIKKILKTDVSENFNLQEAINSSNPRDGKNEVYRDKLLSKCIWTEPLRKAIGKAERVYFSPDGFLHQLGIEYMLPEEIADKRMYRLTSTRLLADKSKWVNTKKLREGSALVCGYIDYDEADDAGVPLIKKLGNDPISYNAARRCGLSTTNEFFKQETERIIAARENHADVMLSGKYATEYAFQNAVGNHSIVHLCTHGCYIGDYNNSSSYSSVAPSRALSNSFLTFAGCNTNTRSILFDSRYKDGILSARELSKMHMGNVELFTTSACQTNMGVVTGDGIYGIVRGLKSSGVKSVVTSLWSVYSEYAAKFMPLFHENIRNGMDVYTAFHTARKELEKDCISGIYTIAQPEVQNVLILIDALETED